MIATLRFALVAAAFAALGTAADAAPAIGSPAPPFHLTTLGGGTVSLESYRGKTLVINVWGSWCPPCRLETPDLIETAKRLQGHGVAFLGIDTTETAAVVRAFVASKGVPYPQAVIAADAPFAVAYDIRNYPTTIVIDPHGIVRAIHADNILPRAQLEAYIAAAQRGATAPLVSEQQRALDALLDPAGFAFGGDPAAVVATARRAADAIAQADDIQDDAMNDAARDHDLLKTHAEEARLRAVAIAALTPVAAAAPERALLARLRGDQAVALGQWSDADAAYAEALALDPADRDALAGRAYAASKRGDDAAVAAIDRTLAELAPSYSRYSSLGRAEAKLGHREAAFAALDHGIRLATSPVTLAWSNLYAGRAAVTLGDPARARANFAAAAEAATRIPASDPHRAWYLEQAQEATVALDLAAGTRLGIALAPWTGPDLPGSLASTLKYRLTVTGTAGRAVTLRASGLPKGWIGSFCSDKLCAPFESHIAIPAGGVKVVEFQIVPGDTPAAHSFTIQVSAASAQSRTATIPLIVAAVR